MKIKFFIPLLLACAPVVLSDNLYDEYTLSEQSNYLNENDHNTLSKLKKLDERSLQGQAFVPGVVEFTYGSGIPTIVCAILELTDIAMEKGERIFSVQLGDTARWSIESALSGTQENRTEHLIIKPLDSGLKTSLLITTDKRAYHLKLKSSSVDYMPEIKFNYPSSRLINQTPRYDYDEHHESAQNYEIAVSHLNYESSVHSRDTNSKGSNISSSGPKNYNYAFDGDDYLLPINIYDDGTNIYIQMNERLKQRELPAILQVTYEKGLIFDEERLSAVNFKVKDNIFIVYGLYERLKITSNNGDTGLSVDIKKLG